MKMTAREYLKQLQNLDTAINENLHVLEGMRMNATGQGAIRYDSDRVQTSPQDRLCSDVCDIVELNEYIDEQIDRFTDLKEKIIKQIRGLQAEQVLCDILFKTYVEYKTNRQVAAEIRKSHSHTFVLKKKALKLFESQYMVYRT
jgi:hypothetical protein